jgi:hypothetical protein
MGAGRPKGSKDKETRTVITVGKNKEKNGVHGGSPGGNGERGNEPENGTVNHVSEFLFCLSDDLIIMIFYHFHKTTSKQVPGNCRPQRFRNSTFSHFRQYGISQLRRDRPGTKTEIIIVTIIVKVNSGDDTFSIIYCMKTDLDLSNQHPPRRPYATRSNMNTDPLVIGTPPSLWLTPP